MNLDTIRGLVRPAVTILLVGGFTAFAWYSLVNIEDKAVLASVVSGFVASATTVVGFWFASRNPSNG